MQEHWPTQAVFFVGVTTVLRHILPLESADPSLVLVRAAYQPIDQEVVKLLYVIFYPEVYLDGWVSEVLFKLGAFQVDWDYLSRVVVLVYLHLDGWGFVRRSFRLALTDEDFSFCRVRCGHAVKIHRFEKRLLGVIRWTAVELIVVHLWGQSRPWFKLVTLDLGLAVNGWLLRSRAEVLVDLDVPTAFHLLCRVLVSNRGLGTLSPL